MQHVQLDLSHDNFYCPVTGFHMLSKDHYEASPATLFVYVEDAGEFEWYSQELEELESTVNTGEIVDECEDGLSEIERFLLAILDIVGVKSVSPDECQINEAKIYLANPPSLVERAMRGGRTPTSTSNVLTPMPTTKCEKSFPTK